jgi:hypothetical protein
MAENSGSFSCATPRRHDLVKLRRLVDRDIIWGALRLSLGFGVIEDLKRIVWGI